MGVGALQPGHLIVILVIVLLIFGPGKLPELGKALGDGMRELKKATSGGEDAANSTNAASTTATAATTPVAPLASTTPGAPTVATRPCPSCAGAVPVGDKFCGHCGATIQPSTVNTV
ncbi:MAG: twin-arginine translocase TatA/TatE family subunit [Chloroflexi bacterium]|nr:twin-arginine translocase TatA/TatE family subunit [Chloroflexota bacterium]MBV9543855.1 twin-arginine translocase TatA/TatE family subunit [Chloroflexota bacterium]